MTDEQLGVPVDDRPAAMRSRIDAGHLGDFELAAARVVARLTGERVVLQDDNSSPGMVDIRIDYREKPPGFVEVVTDIEPAYSALVDKVRRHQQIVAPRLRRVWYVTLDSRAQVRGMVRTLPNDLAALEEAGHHFDTIHVQSLVDHRLPAVRALAAMGVTELVSSQPTSTGTGRIHLYAEGTGGPTILDWSEFDNWLADYLADAMREDVRRKLAATRADERHAFIGMSFTTPWAANYPLGDDHWSVPTSPPRLPPEITHVWAWFYPIGRCIAWFPGCGWFDPRNHWVTE